jgi:hypothetical protein
MWPVACATWISGGVSRIVASGSRAVALFNGKRSAIAAAMASMAAARSVGTGPHEVKSMQRFMDVFAPRV